MNGKGCIMIEALSFSVRLVKSRCIYPIREHPGVVLL